MNSWLIIARQATTLPVPHRFCGLLTLHNHVNHKFLHNNSNNNNNNNNTSNNNNNNNSNNNNNNNNHINNNNNNIKNDNDTDIHLINNSNLVTNTYTNTNNTNCSVKGKAPCNVIPVSDKYDTSINADKKNNVNLERLHQVIVGDVSFHDIPIPSTIANKKKYFEATFGSKVQFSNVHSQTSLSNLKQCILETANDLATSATQQYSQILESDSKISGVFSHQHKHRYEHPLQNPRVRAKQERLEHSQQTYGVEHPKTLAAAKNLAHELHREGGEVDAERIFRDTLSIQRRTIGPNHPNTLETAGMLANTLRCLGKRQEAMDLFTNTLAAQKRILGPTHPHVVFIAANLAAIKKEMFEPSCVLTTPISTHPSKMRSSIQKQLD